MYFNSCIISLLEYKGYVSLVIFLEGCSLKCKHCFNKGLWKKQNECSIGDVYDYIIKSDDYIDAIVITGGEPLEQPEAVKEIAEFAKGLGLKVKLNTNGCHPKELKELIDLFDLVRIDFKPSQKSLCNKSIQIVGDKLEYAESWKNPQKVNEIYE